jgi:hypothetical protein
MEKQATFDLIQDIWQPVMQFRVAASEQDEESFIELVNSNKEMRTRTCWIRRQKNTSAREDGLQLVARCH